MSRRGFRRFTLFALALTLFVIVWGAWVRASGSGAGCGDHWPVCNGQIIPHDPSSKTLIELTHRLTSGLDLLAVIGTLIIARKVMPKGHAAIRWAWWSLFFMLTEAALGALLVKAELVANNATASRALAMSIHLVNTFLLVAAMTRTAFHAHVDARLDWKLPGARLGLAAAALVLIVGVTGSVAALGDTLQQQSISNPFVSLLIELRIIHPMLAVVAAVALLGLVSLAWQSGRATRSAIALAGLVVLQVTVGLVNVMLQAPIAVQLLHLLIADAVWMALLVLAFQLSAAPPVPDSARGERFDRSPSQPETAAPH